MKNLSLIGVFVAYFAFIYFFKDESFVFKSVIFLMIVIPLFYMLFAKVVAEHQNKMKELEDRVRELENKRR